MKTLAAGYIPHLVDKERRENRQREQSKRALTCQDRHLSGVCTLAVLSPTAAARISPSRLKEQPLITKLMLWLLEIESERE